MALTYSLKYKKLNSFNKSILEKEGEVVVDRQSFCLKGKGAKDQGETIYFGDIKDLRVREDHMIFSTFAKEKYVLTDFANLFEAFLKDFMRVRNEYLADALFMKSGMLMKEFDCSVEIVNNYGKVINKGKSRLQFYEGSIVIMPETRECFAIHLNFLKGHEFDDEEFVLRLFLDSGQNVHIAKLGTSYEDVREMMEGLLGKMYERVIQGLTEVLPGLDAQSLLKLAYKVKEGRFVVPKSLKRTNEELPGRLEELLCEKNPDVAAKMAALRKIGGEDNFYAGISVGKAHDGGELFARTWFLQAMPEKNIIAVGRTSSPNDTAVHFFRIIMQQGDPQERLGAKLLEIEQSLLLFRYDFSVVYKDRRELRKSRYRTALKKISFLRLLRKSYLGSSVATDKKELEADVKRFAEKAVIGQQKAALPNAASSI